MNIPQGKKSSLTPKTVARLSSVQALYQMDIAQTPVAEILKEFSSGKSNIAPYRSAPKSDQTLLQNIISGVVKNQLNIDPLINNSLAQGWELWRLDSTVRAILRAATYELMEYSDTPTKVIINEYINITHAFFDSEEPKFVNGVIDKIAKEVRE